VHDGYAKFHKDWFRHPKFGGGTHVDTQTGRSSHKHTFMFFKIRKVG
jgi:hypothetical protein